MTPYQIPIITEAEPIGDNEIILVTSGDLRLSANQECWPAQAEMEEKVKAVFKGEGYTIKRGHSYNEELGHGFIWNQRMGMEVFRNIPKDAKVIVAEAVWQYSHHVLAGPRDHKGPILTLANWNGQWPGLVGMLNLNASLTKMGVEYSTIWSLNFDDEFFLNSIREWLKDGKITHDISHVRPLDISKLPEDEVKLGKALAGQLRSEKAIMGIFDEGCMGMYNGIIEDELLNPLGVYKERLSQSALVAKMRTVSDDEARNVRDWLDLKGMTFVTGTDEATELTERQIHEQCKMYIAAVRIADEFDCAMIGIQYQQGLKDMAPASDVVEGLLNCTDRPPVHHEVTGEILFEGKPLPHFNEVDEGAGLDALITNRVWTSMGYNPDTTLHDVRWGDWYNNQYVWVFLISGSAPPSHFKGGYEGASSERQPPMYFPLGGGSLKGDSKPGEIVWSRVYVKTDGLHVDIGRGSVVELPDEETQRRWDATTPAWPIMSAVLHGVSRDQFMAQHKANHIQVVYAPSAEAADKALAGKAAMFNELGLTVHICGDVKVG
jgi:L-fucose isomerase-like protein